MALVERTLEAVIALPEWDGRPYKFASTLRLEWDSQTPIEVRLRFNPDRPDIGADWYATRDLLLEGVFSRSRVGRMDIQVKSIIIRPDGTGWVYLYFDGGEGQKMVVAVTRLAFLEFLSATTAIIPPGHEPVSTFTDSDLELAISQWETEV